MTAYVPKCVMITGATGDFGRAFATRFAALDAKLILHARDQAKLDALLKDYPGSQGIVCDMTDTKSIDSAMANLPDNIDLLINNAGGALGLDKAHEASLQDWDDMLDMNCRSLMRITRLVLPNMVARKGGHIINIGSVAGTYQYPGGNVYGACKAFVKQFSLNLRADLAGTNVRVTNVEPGMVETQFSRSRFKGDETKAAAVYANTNPLHADDIADAIVWIATQPPHVNVNTIEIMPTTQSFGPLAVERFA